MSKLSVERLKLSLDLARNVNPEASKFAKDLDKVIELADVSNRRKPSKTFKPSSMGGCERSVYFQLIGADIDDDSKSSMLIGICESGTDRHIRIQQHIIDMKNFGIDCEYIDVEDFVKERRLTDIEIVEKDGIETKCYNKKYNISFLTDGIIRYHGKYYILEIKTETDKKYKEHDTYRHEHEAQGIAYRISFGISSVMYLYENRNNTMHKAFIYDVSQEDTDKLIEKTVRITNCVENGIVPEKTNDVSRCKFCNYKGACSNIDCNG